MPTALQLGSPSRSRISTRKAAKPSAAAATWEKYSAANTISIDAMPSVIAAAVP